MVLPCKTDSPFDTRPREAKERNDRGNKGGKEEKRKGGKEEEEPQGLPRIIRVGSFYKLCTNSLAQFVVATPSTQKPTTGRRQQGLEALRGSEGFEGVEQ